VTAFSNHPPNHPRGLHGACASRSAPHAGGVSYPLPAAGQAATRRGRARAGGSERASPLLSRSTSRRPTSPHPPGRSAGAPQFFAPSPLSIVDVPGDGDLPHPEAQCGETSFPTETTLTVFRRTRFLICDPDPLLQSQSDPHIKTFIYSSHIHSLAFRSEPLTPDGAECNPMCFPISATMIPHDSVIHELRRSRSMKLHSRELETGGKTARAANCLGPCCLIDG